eukprot:PITA_28743
MTLAWIPRGILSRLQKICSSFLWKGNKQGNLFAWVKWDIIAKPKRWEGWGIKKLDLFTKTLAAKLGWQLITSHSLWTKVVYEKYISPKKILDWIRRDQKARELLADQGVTHLSHIADQGNTTLLQQAWKLAHVLHIPGFWHQVWEGITEALTQSHIRITEGEDEIVWAYAKNGRYSPNEGYLKLMEHNRPEHVQQWWKTLWKLKAAPRARMLFWTILFNKIPTGSNLMKRTFHGPFWCHLYRNNEENMNNLFLRCPIIIEQWNLIMASSPSLHRWQGRSIMEAWLDWLERHKGKGRNLPLLVCWAFWMARNRAIFDNKDPLWRSIGPRILADFDLLSEDSTQPPPRTIHPELIDKSHPWAYFDGSAQDEGCGGGALLYLREGHCYHIQVKLGRGTNNFAELSITKHLIHFALEKHCSHLQLFGDSKLVCN